MTSSSSRAELAVLALLAAGCAQEVFETQVLVLAETEGCMAADARGTTVNAYRAVLLELPEPDPEDVRPPCVACLQDGTCTFVEAACRCGRPVRPLTVPLNRQLEGLRFSTLEPEVAYCIGLAAYELPTVRRADETAVDCGCGFGGADLTGTSRVCGITPFAARVGENAAFVPISADCPPMGCPAFE